MAIQRRRWTPTEIRFLRRHLGRQTVDWIAAELRRTPNAIWCKANDLAITPADFSHSLQDVIRDTGYNWKQLLKAKKELNQIWEQRKFRSRHYITDEQKQELLRHLAKPGPKYTNSGRPKSDVWCPSLQTDRCMTCGGNRRKHHSLGLCENCFRRLLKKPREHRHHKLAIAYWKLAMECEVSPNAVHPINQLDNWVTCNSVTINQLNIRIHGLSNE